MLYRKQPNYRILTSVSKLCKMLYVQDSLLGGYRLCFQDCYSNRKLPYKLL